MRLRQDWSKIDAILATYTWIIIAIVLLVIAFIIYKIIARRRRGETS